MVKDKSLRRYFPDLLCLYGMAFPSAVFAIFGLLKNEVEAVSSATEDIAKQMKTLFVAKDTIDNSANNLSAVSEENAAATQETSASMQTLAINIEECTAAVEALADMSRDLSDEVSKFVL